MQPVNDNNEEWGYLCRLMLETEALVKEYDRRDLSQAIPRILEELKDA